tara:strand:- start:1090 stop:1704 length:615 start_codon:yes stop_codon:yes gene_type:complete
VDIIGNLTVDNSLNVGGDLTVDNSLNVGGNLTVNNSLFVPGMIIQTQHFYYKDSTTINSGSGWRAVPIQVAITPSSSNSKILISTTVHYGVGGNGRWFAFRLYKDGSVISDSNNSSSNTFRPAFMNSSWGATTGGWEQFTSNISNTYLDSPNTTSEITYQLYCNAMTGNTNDTTTFYINRPHSMTDDYRPELTSYIMAQEIYYP